MIWPIHTSASNSEFKALRISDKTEILNPQDKDEVIL